MFSAVPFILRGGGFIKENNTSFTKWHHYHIMTIQFQGYPANSAMVYLLKFHVCFHQFLIITKTFRGSRILKYLINIELIWLSVTKHKPKLSHGLTCHFMLDRLHWCAKQMNRTSVLLGRYESDDVIWLRNHAYTWMLVPNIWCKQTMASNTGGPLTFFWCSHIFFSDYPKAIRRGEIWGCQ